MSIGERNASLISSWFLYVPFLRHVEMLKQPLADDLHEQSFTTLVITALLSSNFFLDVVSSAPLLDAYECLRSEAASVLKL